MSGKIIRNELNIRYTITHPGWICEWILPFDKMQPIKRSCILNYSIDPLDPSNSDYIIKLIPGLFNDIQRVIKEWIDSGDSNASLLLLTENKPAFIRYAEDTIGLKIIT
jgi:hypothetical protein